MPSQAGGPSELGHAALSRRRPVAVRPVRKAQPRGNGHRLPDPGCEWVDYEPPHDAASACDTPGGLEAAPPPASVLKLLVVLLPEPALGDPRVAGVLAAVETRQILQV